MKLLKFNLIPLIFLTLVLGYLFAQRVHETGHWFFLQVFQREPSIGFLGLIQVWGSQPSNIFGWSLFTEPMGGSQGWLWVKSLPQSNFEWTGFFMMGQIFQIITIFFSFFIIFRAKNILFKNIAFIVVLFNSFSQLIYQAIKFLNIFGGDEYFAAHFWGISPRLITGPLVIFYGIVFVIFLLRIDGWKERASYLFSIILAQALGPILGIFDSMIREQAILNNPLVNPVFGFSLPVIILDVIVLFSFWLLVKNMHRREIVG